MEPAHTIQSPPSSTATQPTHCPEDWGDNREWYSSRLEMVLVTLAGFHVCTAAVEDRSANRVHKRILYTLHDFMPLPKPHPLSPHIFTVPSSAADKTPPPLLRATQ